MREGMRLRVPMYGENHPNMGKSSWSMLRPTHIEQQAELDALLETDRREESMILFEEKRILLLTSHSQTYNLDIIFSALLMLLD